ncbi:MAG: tRNA (adenosine(37)-N6)-threonylcarbamoyltransferase complex ATPase subunit type 1 TsaE [Gemmatimonadaceae bacterium]|nr:tRNA (adenosine(37)-N6)-threonylcarbamoyltransferase complex ATPase subunit type 1 TsaE [Gemmatimonadaceae bacterium]MCW5825464.1 tRNA (adenosine(37)-N6)-threonylcarbamoyltransferase complex ATPase subunit type 1 TsaE [Gemmatimonadaceae bacterium]
MPSAEFTRDALRDWGRALGARLRAPTLVTLRGNLGSGKTTLVQAIAEGLGVTDDVTSPTYALVHHYATPQGPVHHLDLYRLRDAAQMAQLGWDDLLRAGGIILVEWSERGGDAVPQAQVALELAHVPGRADLRRLTWEEHA